MLKLFIYIGFLYLLVLYLTPTWGVLSDKIKKRGKKRKILSDFSLIGLIILCKIFSRAPP
ncbi:hypothetical protein [Ignavibacterium sp.]|uniref:hypothetical protein n=1 Tax=Ignavibacterium sp. TaxID=2651167 RepID=UPI0025BFD417|nr:hypothetical protein [Ignavibacterium sp.]